MSSFTFKQFTVQQDRCAMKVGTDGVLLGCFTPLVAAKNVLDIGTGTGLLALMVAQRQPQATIDAVEMDTEAASQASENFAASPWANRLQVTAETVQNFAEKCDKKYDLIVCNPPYFVRSLTPPDSARKSARHSDSLPYSDLASCVKKMLAENGIFSLILPTNESELFLKIAEENSLFCFEQLHIFPTPQSEVKRKILLFSHTKKELKISQLTIEIARHIYTKEYLQLTQDFYLFA